jgi:DNA polymerase-1
MMTPDKDFGQLVVNIFLCTNLHHLAVLKFRIPEILKKFEIANVSQVIDILGLWGDAVDNIPGIPGVGESN